MTYVEFHIFFLFRLEVGSIFGLVQPLSFPKKSINTVVHHLDSFIGEKFN